MSDFTSGLTTRHDALAQALQRAFAAPSGFAPADIRAHAMQGFGQPGPTGFAPKTDGPRHFSPADPTSNPTEGWNPFEADVPGDTPEDATESAEIAHAAGYDAGYTAGVADARAAMEREGARDQAMLATLAEALRSDGRLDREAVAERLRETVLYLVAQIVGEAGVSAERLAQRIDGAARLLSDTTESAILRVNPADVALLEGKLPDTIFAVGDEAVARGSFVLESASTIVEDGPELWLEQLAQAIDRVAVPDKGA